MTNNTTSIIQMELAPGQMFAHYRIISKVGEGGMGQVYQAWDSKLSRVVALKILLNKRFSSEVQIKRFFKEAQITAKLNHPNIIRLFEINHLQGIFYFTMTYLDGQCLSQKIKEKSLSYQQIANIVCDLAEILDYAHQQNVVHRDLKPSNIIVNQDLKPFILDFGLAKTSQTDYNLTKTGDVLGTPYYMSPEQAQGSRRLVDAQSDVYSLGIILYQMLTHQVPFTGTTMGNILKQVVSATPPLPSEIKKDVPKDLEKVCLQCIAKKKQHRYASGKALAKDLQRYLDGRKVQAKNPYSRVYQRLYLCCVAISLLAIMVIGILQLKNPDVVIQNQNVSHQSLLNLKKIIDTKWTLQSLLNYIQGLLDRGLHNEAIIELENALKIADVKTKNSIYEKLILSSVEIKQFQIAVQYYKKIKELQNQQSTSVVLALAKAHYHLQNFSEAGFLLKNLELPRFSYNEQQQVLYYRGLIAYKRQNYREAQKFFVQIKDIKDYPDTYLYVGICQFHNQSLSQAAEYLSSAQKIFPDMAMVYEFQGKIYSSTEEWEKAAEMFRHCIKLEPENGNYYLLLAKNYLQQQKYEQASSNAYKSMELSDDNYEALKTYFQAQFNGVIDADLQNIIYEYIDRSHIITTPELFSPELEAMQKQYYDYFLEWQSLQNNQGDLQKFFQSIIQDHDASTYNIAMQGLLTLRYHPLLEVYFEGVLKSKDIEEEVKNQVRFAQQTILRKKQRESRLVAYYLIAEFCSTRSLSIRKILLQSQWIKTVEEIVEDPYEKVFMRYLAAKTLSLLLKFDTLELFSENQDSVVATIAICLLREFELLKNNEEPLIKVFESNPRDEFLLFLLAKNLSADTKNIVRFEKLLKSSHQRVVLAAASNFIQCRQPQQQLWQVSKQRIFEAMQEESTIFRRYAHTFFWKAYSKSPLEEYKSYLGEFQRGLLDKDRKVVFIMLYYAIEMAVPECEKVLESLTFEDRDPFIRILAIAALCMQNREHPRMLNIFTNTNEETIIRIIALAAPLFFSVETFKQEEKKDNNLTELVVKSALRLQKILPKFNNDPDPNFRITTIHLQSAMGFKNYEILRTEKNPRVIANLITSLMIEPIQSIGFMTKKISRLELLNIANKYLSHENSLVKVAAYTAFVVASNTENLQGIYQKYRFSSDSVVRQGIARGFYQKVFSEIYGQIKFEEKTQSYTKQMHAYVYRLQRTPGKKRREYMRFLTWAINLEDNGRYYFERAILYNNAKNALKANEDIKKAISLSPNNFLYHLIHAKTLFDLKAQESEEKVAEIIELSYSEYGKTLWRYGPYVLDLNKSPNIDKYFLQAIIVNSHKSLLLYAARVYAHRQMIDKAVVFLQYYHKYNLLNFAIVSKHKEFQCLLEHPWITKLPK